MLNILNYYTVSLFLGGLVALLSGALVYFSDKRKEVGISWMFLNLSTAVWSFGYFSMVTSSSKHTAYLSDTILHYGAILIPLFYLFFILQLTDSVSKYKKILYLILPITFIFLFYCPNDLYVKDVFAKGPFSFVPDAGPLYIYFTLYFFVTVVFAQFILYKFIKSTISIDRPRLWFVFFSSVAGFIGGGSVFFLTFNINFPPYFLPLFAFYPIIITIAILRYKLFDIKIISTELLIGFLWVVLIFRTILSEKGVDQVVNGVVLSLTTVFGILLIRSVYREVLQRERIEKLAVDLEKANERLKELDNLKSEFVSLASHQIRGPIAAIKGYASEILEGDFGELPKHLESPMKTVFHSCESLANIVEDFLNISRIEQGRMKYELSEFVIGDIVNQVLEELKPTFNQKGLALEKMIDDDIMVKADKGKIKQIINNIIDNAIKYTPKGSISVRLEKKDGNALIIVKDTGIGINPKTIPKLFQKFSRAEDAAKANIMGTGLGLYVASQMIKAQGGHIWVESGGDGKGSTFFVELKAIN